MLIIYVFPFLFSLLILFFLFFHIQYIQILRLLILIFHILSIFTFDFHLVLFYISFYFHCLGKLCVGFASFLSINLYISFVQSGTPFLLIKMWAYLYLFKWYICLTFIIWVFSVVPVCLYVTSWFYKVHIH